MKAADKEQTTLSAQGAQGCTHKPAHIKAAPLEALQILRSEPKAQKLKVRTLSTQAAHLIRQLVIYQAGLKSAVEKKDAGLIEKWAQVIARTAHSLSNCLETCS